MNTINYTIQLASGRTEYFRANLVEGTWYIYNVNGTGGYFDQTTNQNQIICLIEKHYGKITGREICHVMPTPPSWRSRAWKWIASNWVNILVTLLLMALAVVLVRNSSKATKTTPVTPAVTQPTKLYGHTVRGIVPVNLPLYAGEAVEAKIDTTTKQVTVDLHPGQGVPIIAPANVDIANDCDVELLVAYRQGIMTTSYEDIYGKNHTLQSLQSRRDGTVKTLYFNPSNVTKTVTFWIEN